MAFLNPVYAIIVPFLFLFTIPLAIFAAITTTISLSILLFRVIIIYIELALAVIPHYLLGLSSSTTATAKHLSHAKYYPTSPTTARRRGHSPPTTQGTKPLSTPRQRKRRSSTSSQVSGTGAITPVPGDSGLGLSQSIGPTRDFEGVGGWRLDNPSDDDALWANINSRLELPADHGRRHHRSLTSRSMPSDVRGNRSYSPEAVMNTSRARTPPTSLVGAGGEYFPQIMSSKALKRTSSVVTGASGSSASSKGSSVLSMKKVETTRT